LLGFCTSSGTSRRRAATSAGGCSADRTLQRRLPLALRHRCGMGSIALGAGRSLSVSWVAGQRNPVGRGWFFAGGWAWRTELGSRWSGLSVAWTTTLTPARDATG
jgi:hypothetical protein